MLIKVNGLIIQEIAQKENDKFITILTAEYGKMSVYCRGVRKIKSQFMSLIELFSYNEFELYEKNGHFWLDDCYRINDFYKLRDTIEGFSLASYILDVLSDISLDGEKCEDVLRLGLNTLYAICEKIKPLWQIKAAFEFKAMCLSGYLPELDGCRRCGKKLDKYTFDVLSGCLVCDKCKGIAVSDYVDFDHFDFKAPFFEMNNTLVDILRFVQGAALNRFLLFDIPNEPEQKAFSRFCELYLLSHLERGFQTLSFYNSL